MADPSNVKLTIAFDDPELDSEEREEQAQNLLAQMKDLDEVETLDRVLDLNPPQGNKSIGAILSGMLTAEVSDRCIYFSKTKMLNTIANFSSAHAAFVVRSNSSDRYAFSCNVWNAAMKFRSLSD